MIFKLTAESVLEHWNKISNWIIEALAHGDGETPLTEYIKRVMDNQAQIWVITDEEGNPVGAALTQYLRYPNYSTLHIVAYGGHFYDQIEMHKVVERFAANSGCKYIEQWGRPGWARELPKHVPGYKQSYVVMRKDLGDLNDIQKDQSSS